MARRIDEVELVLGAIERAVGHRHRLALDGDAPFPLQLHLVQKLRFHVLGPDGAGDLQKAVGQGGFAVVDVGDDAKVAYALLFHNVDHGSTAAFRAATRRSVSTALSHA